MMHGCIMMIYLLLFLENSFIVTFFLYSSFLLIFSALSLFGSKPNLAPHANIRSKRDETDHNTTDQTPTEE